jgi:hypothetical protein
MTSPNITKTNPKLPLVVQPPETSSFRETLSFSDSTLTHWFSPRPAPDALWSRGCCHGWGQPGLSVTTPPPTQRCCSCCCCTLLTVSKVNTHKIKAKTIRVAMTYKIHHTGRQARIHQRYISANLRIWPRLHTRYALRGAIAYAMYQCIRYIPVHTLYTSEYAIHQCIRYIPALVFHRRIVFLAFLLYCSYFTLHRVLSFHPANERALELRVQALGFRVSVDIKNT